MAKGGAADGAAISAVLSSVRSENGTIVIPRRNPCHLRPGEAVSRSRATFFCREIALPPLAIPGGLAGIRAGRL